MQTLAEENYLKSIYKLSGVKEKSVSTTSIADDLKSKASSVTDMLQKLADKKLINYKKYQGVTLTRKGNKIAVNIIRKHRLWEVFLVEKLNFKWDEIHDIAEQLEHIKSEKLIEKLDDFLGKTEFDPHGDPIPDKDGNIKEHQEVLLSHCEVGEKGTIVGLKDQNTDFLQYLESVQLLINSNFTILKKYKYDQSMIVEVKKKEVMVSHQVSQLIFVRKTS
jgi:DtxR family Mn-dependent transcriptional regulator